MSLKNMFSTRTGSSPMLRPSILENSQNKTLELSERMTVAGAINKSLIMGALLLITAAIAWMMPNMIFLWTGAIGGLVCVIASAFRPQWSAWIAPTYALLEGLFIGTISYFYASMYDGIVFHASSLTIALFFLMLFLFKSGIIKVNQTFRSIIIGATAAIAVVYLITLVLSFFSIQVPFIHGNGIFGIGFSLLVVGIAAFNLMLDFDFFEKGEQGGLAKHYEWYAAMGLWVTLIWLYIEMLRLLSKISSRD